MLETVTIHFRDVNQPQEIDFPMSCPHCGKTMKPNFCYGKSDQKYEEVQSTIGILFSCTVPNCSKYFAYQYNRFFTPRDYSQRIEVRQLSYEAILGHSFPENLKVVSPQFIEIYEEALNMEQNNYQHGAGMTYRKALEFLIKDYLILRNPDDKHNISKTMLGQLISQYLSEFPKIQSLAKASTWIGNDETHYTRKHEDKSINDLKNFVDATALFISADELVAQATDFTSKN